ncbi:transcriptional regulator [Kitasatospora phosalacinea]|uniref:transcriptional regulator n=1 Tax=Kitasatospora phosalacinea TaxID=2065 RepID=UPI0035E06010
MIPTELAALAMGVTEATVRKWASRGRITRYGDRQHAKYDLDELLSLRRKKDRRAEGGTAGGDQEGAE